MDEDIEISAQEIMHVFEVAIALAKHQIEENGADALKISANGYTLEVRKGE